MLCGTTAECTFELTVLTKVGGERVKADDVDGNFQEF